MHIACRCAAAGGHIFWFVAQAAAEVPKCQIRARGAAEHRAHPRRPLLLTRNDEADSGGPRARELDAVVQFEVMRAGSPKFLIVRLYSPRVAMLLVRLHLTSSELLFPLGAAMAAAMLGGAARYVYCEWRGRIAHSRHMRGCALQLGLWVCC